MQPARLDLRVDKGATFRAVLRIMQPSLIYKAITAIAATAPVQLTIEHGLPTDWPVWVEQAQQLQALNRAPLRTAPHMARVIDASTIEINTINAAGTNAKGGQLIYQAPLDLAGATAVLQLLEDGAEVGTVPVTVNAGGWLDVELTAAETDALAWAEREYVLDVTLASGEVLRAFAGTVAVVVAGASAGQMCSGSAVVGGDRGPAGPTIDSATVNEDGHLILTLENGTEIDAGVIDRPWGTIQGDITQQLDLMQRLGLKVDKDNYDAFALAVNNSLADRYTKSESDGRYDASGAASAAVGGHVATLDPHTQYLNEDRADDRYVGLEPGKGLSTNDFTNQYKVKLDDLENFDPSGINAELETKVDKVPGKQLSTNDFTTSLRDKLAALESSHFRGTFLSLEALEAGVADAVAGDYADVDGGEGINIARYIWDVNDIQWVVQSGEVAPITAAQVKALYESNPDTNAFGDADKSKLESVAADATANQTDAYLRNRANHTGTQPISSVVDLSTQLAGKVASDDARMTNARDWTATEVPQLEAETGEATTARKWTSLRIRQATAAWWAGLGTAFGREFVSLVDAAAGRTKLELGTFATQNYSVAPFTNLMPDSGRFAGKMNPLSQSAPSTFIASPFFSAYNGAALASAGKFIHNNTTNGGSAGELSIVVQDIIAAMGRGGNFARYGVEFLVLEITAGSGVVAPGTGTDSVTRYLVTTSGGRAIFGSSSYATFVGWVYVTSGGIHIASSFYMNSVLQPAGTPLPIGTPVHIRINKVNGLGYETAFPNMYAEAGTVINIAVPAFFSGLVDAGIHVSPLPTVNELST